MSKMTNKEALDLIQHKLDLAVDDALIMTDKEYEVFSLCAKALEQIQAIEDVMQSEATWITDEDGNDWHVILLEDLRDVLQ